jgi:hypothetical protein
VCQSVKSVDLRPFWVLNPCARRACGIHQGAQHGPTALAGANNVPRPITFEEFTAFIEQGISTQRTRIFQEIEATLAAMEP